MSIASSISTAEELLNAGDIGRCELIRGELIMMTPAGPTHGIIVSRINRRIGDFVEQSNLGETFGAETGFLISRNPDTVRAPDAAFIRRERLAEIPERGFFPGAPDLAVEVLSPDDTASRFLAKVADWLGAGSSEVWVVDPQRRTIAIYRSDDTMTLLNEHDKLHSERLLPGLSISVGEIFR